MPKNYLPKIHPIILRYFYFFSNDFPLYVWLSNIHIVYVVFIFITNRYHTCYDNYFIIIYSSKYYPLFNAVNFKVP